MAAIIRVKRRRADNPAENILLSCKRARNDESAEIESKDPVLEKVLKFAGTVDCKDAVTQHIRDAIKKDKLQREYKGHHVDVGQRSREHQKKVTKTARYKIVTQKRAIDLDSLDDSPDTQSGEEEKKRARTTISPARSPRRTKNVTGEGDASLSESKSRSSEFYLYDIEEEASPPESSKPCHEVVKTADTICCNGVPLVRERVAKTPQQTPPSVETDYVYDLYYMNQANFDFRQLEDMLSIEAFREDYDFQEYRDDPYAEHYDDDDDSNDEGNWRNDYPDEDPMYFENAELEDYYRDCFESGVDPSSFKEMHTNFQHHLRVGTEELSSDDEADPLYHGKPLDVSTVWTPKTSYEKYKARVKKELEDG